MPLRLLAAALLLASAPAVFAQEPPVESPPAESLDLESLDLESLDAENLDAESLEPAPSPVTGELNPPVFIRSSVAGLRFMVEASELATERPMSATARALAEAMGEANAALMRDLFAAMEARGVPIPEAARRMAAGEPAMDDISLDRRLAQLLAALRAAEETEFEREWLRVMADGLESARRWWSAYVYRGQNEAVRHFAEVALPTIQRLADAVQAARLERFLR